MPDVKIIEFSGTPFSFRGRKLSASQVILTKFPRHERRRSPTLSSKILIRRIRNNWTDALGHAQNLSCEVALVRDWSCNQTQRHSASAGGFHFAPGGGSAGLE